MKHPVDSRLSPGASDSTAAWWQVESPPAVLAFMEHLRCLPLRDWAQASDQVGSSPPRAHLRREMDRAPRLARVARRKIDDLLAATEGLISDPTRHAMRKVALTAVLAVAARERLSPGAFEHFYAPFAELIPVESLSDGVDLLVSA
jgi:hypothetical protein